jgi:hypothetical protein
MRMYVNSCPSFSKETLISSILEDYILTIISKYLHTLIGSLLCHTRTINELAIFIKLKFK